MKKTILIFSFAILAMIIFVIAAPPDVTINYPTGNLDYGAFGDSLIVNFTTSANGTCIVDYNKINTTFGCGSLISINSGHGVIDDEARPAVADYTGMKIKITNFTTYLVGLTKFEADNVTRGLLLTEGKAIIDTCNFTGAYCEFVNAQTLIDDTIYYVVGDDKGGSEKRQRRDPVAGYPYGGHSFNWIASLEAGGSDKTDAVWTIEAINVSENPIGAIDVTLGYPTNLVFYSNDTNGSSFSIYHTWNWTVFENSESYNSSTGDLSYESFIINITLSDDIVGSEGIFNYNGTKYSGTKSTIGDNTIFSVSLTTPAVSSAVVKNFNWEFIITNSTSSYGINSTANTQSVAPSNFSICGVPYGEMAVNYTMYDESTLTPLVSDFDASFSWRLGQNSSLTKNLTVDLSGSSNYTFCINVNKTFYIDADIKLSAPLYSDRNYFFNDIQYSNLTTHQRLYLLNSTEATDVIIVLKDSGLIPLEGYTIKIYRKDNGILVENDVTDVFGQIVANLVEDTVKYKLEFYNTNNVLVKTVPDAIVACRSAICIQQFIIEDDSDPFSPFKEIDDYSSGLTFDEGTNTFSFNWVDNTGVSSTHRLEVTRYLWNNVSLVCNSTSALASGILSCAVGNQKASYTAAGYKTASPEMRRELSGIRVGSLYNVFGLEGLFLSVMLLMTLILAGVYYPPAGVILYLFGTVLLAVFDIIYINPAIMVAQLVIGGLFIWLFRG